MIFHAENKRAKIYRFFVHECPAQLIDDCALKTEEETNLEDMKPEQNKKTAALTPFWHIKPAEPIPLASEQELLASIRNLP